MMKILRIKQMLLRAHLEMQHQALISTNLSMSKEIQVFKDKEVAAGLASSTVRNR